MPTIAQGSSADITVSADSTLTVQNPGGYCKVENPIGTVIREGGAASWPVDVVAGVVRVTAITGGVQYEITTDPPAGNVAVTTDAASGRLVYSSIPGFVGGDRATMVFVRDHAYQQIAGDASHDAMHDWFRANGVHPYSLTVNTVTSTAHLDGNSHAVDGPSGLTWQQVRELQADGVEVTNHSAYHIGSLRAINTGFTLTYTGVNATATAYVACTAGLDPVLHCVDSADHTFDLTAGAYDTLAELEAAVEALPGWAMTLAPELDGTERSIFTLGVVSGNAKNCKNVVARFALSGGLLLRYSGDRLHTAAVRCYSGSYVQLLGDGVVLAELSLSSGAYDTLAEVATYINTTAFGGESAGVWQCMYLSAEGSAVSYSTGVEASRYAIGGLAASQWKDVRGQYAYLHAGMPIEMVWAKLLEKARADAASHGVVLRNFSDVGGPAPSDMMPAISEYNNMARVTVVENAVFPTQLPVDCAWVVCGANSDDDTTSVTTSCLAAMVDALVDSPGFVVSPFLHSIRIDGTSGKSFLDASGAGYWSETKCAAFVAKVKAARDGGSLNMLTQQGFYEARQQLAKPANRVFNPRLRNSGVTMHGLGATSAGNHIPGWTIATANATEFSVSDGKLTATWGTASSSNYIAQLVYLVPGKAYRIGMFVESLAYTSGNGVYWYIEPVSSYEYAAEYGATSRGVWLNDYLTVGAKALAASVHVPPLERKRAYIRNAYNAWDNDTNKTWDLSGTKHIKLNIDALGAIEIDCSSGAGAAAAVYAYEIAAAINAAVMASATYKAVSEYHTIARAEAGYLILESPYISTWTQASGQITITAGTTTDATLKIFGGQSGADRPMGVSSPSPNQGMVHPYRLNIVFQAVGRFRLSGIHVTEVESVT